MKQIQHKNTIVFKKQIKKCNRGVPFFPCRMSGRYVMLAQSHVLAQHFFGSEIFLSLPAPICVACWRSFPNTSKLENAMSQVSKRKKTS